MRKWSLTRGGRLWEQSRKSPKLYQSTNKKYLYKLKLLTLFTVNFRYYGHPASENFYRCLTETISCYDGLSLLRTLTRGPESVRYKGSGLYLVKIRQLDKACAITVNLSCVTAYFGNLKREFRWEHCSFF